MSRQYLASVKEHLSQRLFIHNLPRHFPVVAWAIAWTPACAIAYWRIPFPAVLLLSFSGGVGLWWWLVREDSTVASVLLQTELEDKPGVPPTDCGGAEGADDREDHQCLNGTNFDTLNLIKECADFLAQPLDKSKAEEEPHDPMFDALEASKSFDWYTNGLLDQETEVSFDGEVSVPESNADVSLDPEELTHV